MNIRLCYKVSADIGLSEDENGNSCETYVCASLKNVKTYNMPTEDYKNAQEGMRKVVANNLECDIKFITAITLNEYLDNTKDDED